MKTIVPRRRIAICVDDVGQHAGIHRAALALVEQRRVSALSCMVHGQAWSDAAQAMRDAAGSADIGLHLDLTESFGARRFRMPWRRLVIDALLRRLDERSLHDEIAAQFDAFERGVGQAPRFVDGHRHVHQLPGVRELLVREITRRYPTQRPWLRRTVPRQPLRAGPKALVIAALGSHGLDALAERHGLQRNRCMLGVYAFRDDESRYLHRLAQWLQVAEDGDLLICHPASAAGADDAIASARLVEHRVLTSAPFAQVIAAKDIDIARLSELVAA